MVPAVNVLGLKGLATGPNYYGVLPGATKVDGYYPTKYLEVGPVFDLMVNLTNWWCGYKPNRVYNATAYVGAGAYFTFTKKYKDNSNEAKISGAHNDIMTLRAGIINSFRVSQQVALSLDVRFSGLDGLQNYGGEGWNSALLTTSKTANGLLPLFPFIPNPKTATLSVLASLLPMLASPTSKLSSKTASTVLLRKLRPFRAPSLLSTTPLAFLASTLQTSAWLKPSLT